MNQDVNLRFSFFYVSYSWNRSFHLFIKSRSFLNNETLIEMFISTYFLLINEKQSPQITTSHFPITSNWIHSPFFAQYLNAELLFQLFDIFSTSSQSPFRVLANNVVVLERITRVVIQTYILVQFARFLLGGASFVLSSLTISFLFMVSPKVNWHVGSKPEVQEKEPEN